MSRRAQVHRKTKETNITLSLNLDGHGRYHIDTSIPFLNHMLELFSKHAGFDVTIRAGGDTHIDDHHLVEDLGLVLGEALRKALGKKIGIHRFGQTLIPMDESLSYVAIDLSGRPHCEYDVRFRSQGSGFEHDLFEDFFRALANTAGMNLHINLVKGRSNHHIAESMFKAFARALSQAVAIDPKRRGVVPSTKGRL